MEILQKETDMLISTHILSISRLTFYRAYFLRVMGKAILIYLYTTVVWVIRLGKSERGSNPHPAFWTSVLTISPPRL